MKFLLIEDEVNSADYLMSLLIECGIHSTQITTCLNAPKAVEMLHSQKFDVVFIDVEMPFMNGFEVLEKLEKINFKIIFTTAFDKYALKAIKFSALDYLLKPIDKDELDAALNKLSMNSVSFNQQQLDSLIDNIRNPELNKIAIPNSGGLDWIHVKDIVRCESDGNYTNLYLDNYKKLVASKTLKEFETLLNDLGFVRIHHSHLINLSHLQKYNKGENGSVVMDDGSVLEVSRRKKEEFIRRLNQ